MLSSSKGNYSFVSFYSFILFFINRELPLIAAKPLTKAPIKAVTSINRKGEPNENSFAIFCDKMLLFLTSIHRVKMLHNINMERKADKKLRAMDCCTRIATRNATMAMLHHGKYKLLIKLRSAVNNIDKTIFILSDSYC